MRAVDIIRAKRDGEALTREAIDAFVGGIGDGSWADYQISALLMAIVLRGMTAEETAWLTDAMVRSGRRVDLSGLPGVKVGKHSTGGVGDKVSIVLAPLVASCGVIVPKMSGRGLGHTGGTLDKLEAIPGFRVALSIDEFLATLAAVGCCMISQTADIVPADKRLYALRDVTATIESVPLISASVMSKKLAEGSNAVVLDVKCGRGAFMKTAEEALCLARSLVSIGTAHGVATEALITRMDAPLGLAVGNALEIAECVATLAGRGPADLEDAVVTLARRMVVLGRKAATEAEAERLVREALASGTARRTFAAMIARQGGDPGVVDDPARLPQSLVVRDVPAVASGFVADIDAERIGRASMQLGAGREKVGDAIDPAAGIVLQCRPGDTVRTGDPLLTLHSRDEALIDLAFEQARSAVTVSDTPPAAGPLVLAWVHAEGEVRYA
jgi:pyrimidine-nucleoside phosphorylase